MCDRDGKGAPSIFKVIRSAAALASMLPILDLSCEGNATRRKGTVHWSIAQAELLKLQKSGQFPDELVKIEGHTNSLCSLPDVLAIAGIKEIALGGVIVLIHRQNLGHL